MVIRSWRRPSRRLVLPASRPSRWRRVVGGVAYSAGAASPQPAIQTSTPRSRSRSPTSTCCASRSATTTATRSAPARSRRTATTPRRPRSVAADGGSAGSGRCRTTRTATKAILLDVDDTSLATWNYEIASNWAFNPTTNARLRHRASGSRPCRAWSTWCKTAEREGYAIFFLTGRGAAQEPATLGNLTEDGIGVDAGYPKPTALRDGEDGLFTKPAVADYPDYLKTACAADPNGSCTTIHYKSATRAHIESLGYDIVANFGDQFSDLKGGYADRTFKLPEPELLPAVTAGSFTESWIVVGTAQPKPTRIHDSVDDHHCVSRGSAPRRRSQRLSRRAGSNSIRIVPSERSAS